MKASRIVAVLITAWLIYEILFGGVSLVDILSRAMHYSFVMLSAISAYVVIHQYGGLLVFVIYEDVLGHKPKYSFKGSSFSKPAPTSRPAGEKVVELVDTNANMAATEQKKID